MMEIGKISEIPKSHEIQNFGFRKKLTICSQSGSNLLHQIYQSFQRISKDKHPVK